MTLNKPKERECIEDDWFPCGVCEPCIENKEIEELNFVDRLFIKVMSISHFIDLYVRNRNKGHGIRESLNRSWKGY